MRDLTVKQKMVYDFIIEQTNKNKFQPSYSEISENFNIKRAAVYFHLVAIERKGYIKLTGKPRGIEILK